MHQSYGLTKQEQNTRLRKAINDQKFDWRNNPAIDLQNAISQAHMSLPEIDSNEIFRETLKDALKYKLQPHYHLIADTPLIYLPDKLRQIWKNIAIPQPEQKTAAETEQPTTLHTTSTPKINTSRKQEKTRKPPDKNPNETLHHYLSQQLHSLSQQVAQLQQSQPQNDLPQQMSRRRPETRTYFICKKTGHIARRCRNSPITMATRPTTSAKSPSQKRKRPSKPSISKSTQQWLKHVQLL